MPRPAGTESESDFVRRYLASRLAHRRHPDPQERLAAAHVLWGKRDQRRQQKSLDQPRELSPWIYKAGMDVEALDAAPSRIELNRATMSAAAIFSSESRDRQGDVLRTAGIQTSNHQRNPVVLLDHGQKSFWTEPLGRTTAPDGHYTVQCDADLCEATQTTYFHQGIPQVVQLYRLIDDGVIAGNSIGFRPIKVFRLPPDAKQNLPGGKEIAACELLEISWCAIPVNQDCVATVLGRNRLEGSPLEPAIKSLLLPYAPDPKAWANGADLSGGVVVKRSKKSDSMSSVDEAKGGALRGKREDAQEQTPKETDEVAASEKDQPDKTEETAEKKSETPRKDKPSAMFLRDFHADANRFHDTYRRDVEDVEHEHIVPQMHAWLDGVQKMVAEMHECMKKHHPDASPMEWKGLDAEEERMADAEVGEAGETVPVEEDSAQDAAKLDEEEDIAGVDDTGKSLTSPGQKAMTPDDLETMSAIMNHPEMPRVCKAAMESMIARMGKEMDNAAATEGEAQAADGTSQEQVQRKADDESMGDMKSMTPEQQVAFLKEVEALERSVERKERLLARAG